MPSGLSSCYWYNLRQSPPQDGRQRDDQERIKQSDSEWPASFIRLSELPLLKPMVIPPTKHAQTPIEREEKERKVARVAKRL